ncbi:hypothetical protein ABZ904_17895 [Streptomyces sp. NPDC046900]|uniref:hypothetical protein n=1 Tax=Streptomyces sp. NPDC046900 TaxID=3155473 RepID=UPI0034116DA9
MSESGQSWRREFKAHPAEARQVREWVGIRLAHPDAPQVANELFVSVLGSGTELVEMTLSTAGSRTRVVAAGSAELSLLQSHGPGFSIVNGLSVTSGLNTDGRGLWAHLDTAREDGAVSDEYLRAYKELYDHALTCRDCPTNCADGAALRQAVREAR